MQIAGPGAIVAGGASGLGAATARRLIDAGATVTIADRNEELGRQFAGETGATFAHMDVTDPESVQAAVDAAAQDAPLRISVNCAGIGWAQRTAGKHGPHDL